MLKLLVIAGLTLNLYYASFTRHCGIDPQFGNAHLFTTIHSIN
jgi:hypothetical protein